MAKKNSYMHCIKRSRSPRNLIAQYRNITQLRSSLNKYFGNYSFIRTTVQQYNSTTTCEEEDMQYSGKFISNTELLSATTLLIMKAFTHLRKFDDDGNQLLALLVPELRNLYKRLQLLLGGDDNDTNDDDDVDAEIDLILKSVDDDGMNEGFASAVVIVVVVVV
uniref:Uncharacterized protein n=1 Tax=Glossina pallidipes TaxID=7398 RepID=A0A1A9ZIF2_GLOPL